MQPITRRRTYIHAAYGTSTYREEVNYAKPRPIKPWYQGVHLADGLATREPDVTHNGTHIIATVLKIRRVSCRLCLSRGWVYVFVFSLSSYQLLR